MYLATHHNENLCSACCHRQYVVLERLFKEPNAIYALVASQKSESFL